MRRDYLGIGLLLLGSVLTYGGIENFAGNQALGNTIEGVTLVGMVAMGIAGVAALMMGAAILFQTRNRGQIPFPSTPTPATAPTPPGGRVSRSAKAFFIVLVLMAIVYILLVFSQAGIRGVVLQFVFWIPIAVVVLLLAYWWSRSTRIGTGPPPSVK